jgi:hypothetical protein
MSIVSEQLFGIIGKSIKQKIIVIESDDWGLVRMPSKQAFQNLKNSGIQVDSCPYNVNDSLENLEDISRLDDFCKKFRDKNGNFLKITANFIMANPDFESIKSSSFQRYSYNRIDETYIEHQGNLDTLYSIKEAYQNGTFIPQLHGREHLQVNHWLRALRNGNNETLLAFQNGIFGHPSVYGKSSGIHFLSAFHISNKEDLEFTSNAVLDAAIIFEETFGFKFTTFIAPRYIWPLELEGYFKNAGIMSLQGTQVQLIPQLNNSNELRLRKRINWMGKKNAKG